MKNQDAVHLFIMFGFNYPHNFISKIWSGHMLAYLQSKFDNYYQAYGSRAVMGVFYTSLDTENQEKLINWVLENYKG